MPTARPLLLAALTLWAVAAASPAARAQCPPERASVDSAGTQADRSSTSPSISNDGRYVVFSSHALNLGSTAATFTREIYLRDRLLGTTTPVTTGPGGVASDGGSVECEISPDGGWVAFVSGATNLTGAPDTNGLADVLLLELATGTITRVSEATGGVEAVGGHALECSLSANGDVVVFLSEATNMVPGDTNGLADVFVHVRATGATTLVDPATLPNALSWSPDVSADGRFVVFASLASNLVASDTQGFADVFLRDRAGGFTTRVSVNSLGAFADDHSAFRMGTISPGYLDVAISDDGSTVAFPSLATNLDPANEGVMHVYRYDVAAQTTEIGALEEDGTPERDAGYEYYFDELSLDTYYYGNGMALSPSGDTIACGASSGNTRSRLNVTRRALGVGYYGSAWPPDPTLISDGREPSVAADGAYAFLGYGLLPGVSQDDAYVRECAPARVLYCEAQTNSQGCVPEIRAPLQQTPSVTSTDLYRIRALNVLNQKSGILFYGFVPISVPFLGGTLCVQPPLKRTPVQSSGGDAAPANNCTGIFRYEFNPRIQSGIDPALTVGADVHCQYWSRDPQDPSTTNLTDAVHFRIQP